MSEQFETTTSTDLARQPGQIKDLLKSEAFRDAVRLALPRHLTADRFVRIALNATMRQPELLNCTRESLFRCLLDLSAFGLEPDGRRAHLIPFRDNRTRTTICTLILDYKGIVELVRRSGDVSYIHADVVYAQDEFEWHYGSGAKLVHKPAEKRDGPIKWAYSFVRLKDGSEDFMVLSRGEVEKVRGRSKAGDNGPWKTDYDEMAKKTAFRRHSKWLPLTPEVRDAIERDDEAMDLSGGFAADVPDGGSREAQREAMERKLAELKAQNAAAGIGQEEESKPSTEPAEDPTPLKVEVLPDPMEFEPLQLVEYQGRVYRPSEDRTTWRDLGEAKPKEAPAQGQQRAEDDKPKFGQRFNRR